MILKKPYALLIKNFRKIHILLTILSVLIVIETNKIAGFFRAYTANNYSVTVTDDLVSTTINPWIYVLILVTIGILVAIFVLLKNKKKPTKMYFFTILYYVILLIFIIIAAFLIGSLSKGLWATANARTYRDFANLVYYPSLIFPVLLGLRGLGFNVKQFNFKSDLKELEITEKDSEEIELNLNFQTYKAERTIRRFIRELKYYYLENKRVFYIIGGVLVLVLGFFLYKNAEKLKYTYKENKLFTYNNLSINVKESMITDLDLQGNIIDKSKYYVVIKFDVKNNSNHDMRIDYDNFKLYYGTKYVYPKLSVGNSFLDFGDPYMNDVLPSGASRTYIMPYEIDKKYKNRNFKIVLYIGTSTKSQDFLAKTATIKLKPIEYTNVENVRTANLNEVVSFSSSSLKNSSLNIKSMLITNRYEYKYECGYKENMYECTDVVVADASYLNRSALIVMDYDLVLDKEVAAYQNINDASSFVDYFMELEYRVGKTTKKVEVKYANPPRDIDKLIIQTDGNIVNASSIRLLVTIRNRSYTIKLK